MSRPKLGQHRYAAAREILRAARGAARALEHIHAVSTAHRIEVSRELKRIMGDVQALERAAERVHRAERNALPAEQVDASEGDP